MIVSFRCSPRLKEQVDGLIERGVYPDFSAFCAVALENQLLAEEGQSGKAVLFGKAGTPPLFRKPKGKAKTTQAGTSSSAPSVKNSPMTPSFVMAQTTLPAELNVAQLDANPPFGLPSGDADLFKPGETVPVDRWLFGQYNRVLPAKVSVRSLVWIAAHEGKEALVLDSVAGRIAELAAGVGDYLRMLDRKFATHRDDALATAFPETGTDGQKGRVRYQNHFVGHTVRGEQGGLLVGLKLATVHVIKNRPHILPTTAGWQFALLENPLLDGMPLESNQRLAQKERDFLLSHIRDHVPVELFAYRVLLALLDKGLCSPKDVNTALLGLLSPGRRAEDTLEFTNTQRSGVLARMTDLGLVIHEREGRYVNRTITAEGKRFLTEVGIWELATDAQ